MMKRIIFDILLLISVIVCPWWFTVIFAIATLYLFKSFNEVIFFALIMDILYGQISSTFYWSDYKFTVFFIIILITSFFIKKYLKFYNK
jgi:hypothetical protein